MPASTNRDELYSACTAFLATQDTIIEDKQRLIDAYLENDPLQNILNTVAGIIDNPVMVIDNSFRVIAASEYNQYIVSLGKGAVYSYMQMSWHK